MRLIIFLLGSLYIIYLVYEYRSLSCKRKGFEHIIHVNGIRGKSTVSRLIDAGLREGGRKVFTKTTGTSPRMLYVDGSEHEIKRRGRANIREQISIIRKARAQGADILVIECMAVKPELQKLSQDRLVAADIGVITNVRLDHMDEMGSSLEEIAGALSSVIPDNGRVFTADRRFFAFFDAAARQKGSSAVLAEDGYDVLHEIDFEDNVSLALAVCRELNVDEETALRGMRKYRKDPGSLRVYKRLNSNSKSLTFINAMAANDPESTSKIMDSVFLKYTREHQKKVLLINNRGDRLVRMQQFCDFAVQNKDCFDSFWICGSLKQLMASLLIKAGIPAASISVMKGLKELEQVEEDTAVFAVGNIAGSGWSLMKYMEGVGGSFGG